MQQLQDIEVPGSSIQETGQVCLSEEEDYAPEIIGKECANEVSVQTDDKDLCVVEFLPLFPFND